MKLAPITLREANAFVDLHHRHHQAATGHKFSISVRDGEQLVGVAIVGRPVARGINHHTTAEVLRLCTVPGADNACSMLYAACWRAAKAMGYQKIITYTLIEEHGASLRAAGWVVDGQTKGGTWSCAGRPTTTKAELAP